MLTRGQMIDEALSQIGRTDLKINARLWLNLFLDKIYRTQDFEWLVKNSGTIALTEGGSFPGDYRSLKSALLLSSNGNVEKELHSLTADEYFYFQNQIAGSGKPQKVYLDLLNKKFRFLPVPDQSYSWKLLYFHIPDLPDHTNSASDLEEVVWGLPEEILIRSIQLKGLYYNDDARYQSELKELMDEVIQGKMNSHDKRGGKSGLKFGKSFAKRFNRSF